MYSATIKRIICTLLPAVTLLCHGGVVKAEEVKLLLVTGQDKGVPKLKPMQVKRFVEAPLKDHARIFPLPQVRRVARRARVAPMRIGTVDGALEVAEELGATHALVLTAQRERERVGGRMVPTFYVRAQLFTVSNGEQLLDDRFALKGRMLNAAAADPMIVAIVEKLAPKPEPEPAAPAPEPEEDMPEPPPMPPPPVAEAEPEPEPEPEPIVEEPPVIAIVEEPEPAEMEVIDAVSADAANTDVDGAGGVPGRRGRWRHGIRARAGAYMFWRRASLEDESPRAPINYGGDPLPAGLVDIELYPIAFGGRGAWYEGIGLHVEGMYTQVQTVNEITQQSTTSNVFAVKGGLTFRLVFWDDEAAPDFRLRGGYLVSRFPLEGVQFPGAGYEGGYVGGEFVIPLGTPMLALTFSGHYVIAMLLTGDTGRLGDTITSPMGFRGEGGLRFRAEPFEATLGGRFEQFSASYTGGNEFGFTDSSFVDRNYGAFLTVGIAY